jgi:hypothetical protein
VVALNGVPAFTFPVVVVGTFLECRRRCSALVTRGAGRRLRLLQRHGAAGIVILGSDGAPPARLAASRRPAPCSVLVLTLLFIGGIRESPATPSSANAWRIRILRFVPIAWFLGLYELIAARRARS